MPRLFVAAESKQESQNIGMMQRGIAVVIVCHPVTAAQLGKIQRMSTLGQWERLQLRVSQCLSLFSFSSQSLPFLLHLSFDLTLLSTFFFLLISSSVFLATSSISSLEVRSHEHQIQGLSEDQDHYVTDPECSPAPVLSLKGLGPFCRQYCLFLLKSLEITRILDATHILFL